HPPVRRASGAVVPPRPPRIVGRDRGRPGGRGRARDQKAAVPMKLELTKHHGLGNDFLVLFGPPAVDLPALAVQLCDRRRGVGADGLLVGEDAPGYAARMTLYNADGSRAEMSGNGIRCFAQAVTARRGGSGD